MKIHQEGESGFEEKLKHLLERRQRIFHQFSSEADELIQEYKEKKDQALVEFALRFDSVELQEEELWIDPDQIKNAHKLLTTDEKSAIEMALKRIERFQNELRSSSFQTQDESGVYWGEEVRPLESVGIYVPRHYFLTLLLSGVPARLAGVEEIIVATPPKKSLGSPWIEPAVLYVAKLLEIEKILLAGGVGAMAALAMGSKSHRAVEKIFGPCRKLTSVAKQKLSHLVGIDGIVGPTEVGFIGDDSTDVRVVAADIVAITEYNADAEIFVFHTQENWLRNLLQGLVDQIDDVKDRDALKRCLESRTHLFLCRSVSGAIELSNRLSPAYLSVQTKNAADRLPDIRRCGAVLFGSFTPPSAIDLVGGATGIVSTLGASAFLSPTGPASFVRRIRLIQMEEEALKRLKPHSQAMAKIQGFEARDRSFDARLDRAH